MKRLALPPLLAALALMPLAHAEAANGLSAANFVEVGDSVSEMLDTSALAFSTMLMDSAAMPPSMRTMNLGTVGAPPAPRLRAFKQPCPGGGRVDIVVLDNDASGDLSTRDRFKLDFGACAITGNVVSGHSEFVVVAHRFEGMSEITELEFRFKALGSAAMRWSGAAHAVLRSDLQRGTESYVVRYRDMTVTRGSHAMRWNFSVDMVRPPIGDQVASVEGGMTVDGLPLQLHQDEPFAIAADGQPRSGQVTAGDRHGARLQIEAMRRRYAYRLFGAKNAGELPDSVSQSKPYGGG
jgi:hypothetical protein